MAQKTCTFDNGTCEGWSLQNGGQIVNTSTHSFTTPSTYNSGGKRKDYVSS